MRPAAVFQKVTVWQGFTVIELLVVVAILGVLFSLFAPTVLQTREVASRLMCEDHLRQLGVGLLSFEGTTRSFPETRFSDHPESPLASVHVRLLPYLDQRELFVKVDWTDENVDLSGEPVLTIKNAGLLRESVALFRCPSDQVSIGSSNYRVCTGSGAGLFQTEGRVPPDASLAGIATGARRTHDVRDGLSNTVSFSERVRGDFQIGVFASARDVILGVNGPQLAPSEALQTCASASSTAMHFSWAGGTWLYGGYGHTWYNHVATPNALVPDCTGAVVLDPLAAGVHAARSWHVGGVNVSFVDGHVRFVGNSVNTAIWRALATVNGRETTSLTE